MGLTRKQTLLKLIVEDFIKTAEPVGSNYLIQKYNLNISSATIRNEMNALEKEGLLEKTHTSSGRVPSNEGYKYYIENLRNSQIDENVKNEINTIFSKTASVDEVLKETNTVDKQCNIYDMAGNCREWSTETSTQLRIELYNTFWLLFFKWL